MVVKIGFKVQDPAAGFRAACWFFKGCGEVCLRGGFPRSVSSFSCDAGERAVGGSAPVLRRWQETDLEECVSAFGRWHELSPVSAFGCWQEIESEGYSWRIACMMSGASTEPDNGGWWSFRNHLFFSLWMGCRFCRDRWVFAFLCLCRCASVRILSLFSKAWLNSTRFFFKKKKNRMSPRIGDPRT